jgi:hypothetical protein
VSTLVHATVYIFLHDLLNVLVQIANKMGLQKNNYNWVIVDAILLIIDALGGAYFNFLFTLCLVFLLIFFNFYWKNFIHDTI